ncbi:hypothetical protein ACHMW6_25255 [Pseudoduganella sp. UC29_106]|uniref:hypothetical protein n=1 Tax=Pseudoduganella sp. UC29_106 TaxID=3374553 RepID=UPI003757504C
MKRIHSLLLAVVGAPLLVYAQPLRVQGAATDPDAAVPPLKYQSAFFDYQPAVEPDGAPDKQWVPANQAAAGGADHSAHGNASLEMNPPPANAPAAAPAAGSAPHKEHQMKEKGH